MKKETNKISKCNETKNSTTSNSNNEKLIAQRTADLMPTVAANLRKLIETQGINQKILSEQTGYCEAAICKYVNAKQFPQLDFFFELKKLYDISIDDFLSKEINENGMSKSIDKSELERAEEILYKKYCGTYFVYYFDTSNYKGRDNNSPSESLVFGILHIYETKTNLDKSDYSCIALLGIRDRKKASSIKKTFESLDSYKDIENFIKNDPDDSLSNKAYYGDFEFSNSHAFITLAHDRKDKALIILHRVNTNKKEYIGGIGTINSISKGREAMPTLQFMAVSRYAISLSDEEIHHNLLLSYPTFKADREAKELIALFKSLYLSSTSEKEELSELQKQLNIKVNLERYIKKSLESNMFRYGKISNRDDEAWYKLLKEVSIYETTEEESSAE